MSDSDVSTGGDDSDEAEADAVDEAMDRIRTELDEVKHGADGTKGEAIAKAEGLLDQLEGTLQDVRRN